MNALDVCRRVKESEGGDRWQKKIAKFGQSISILTSTPISINHKCTCLIKSLTVSISIHNKMPHFNLQMIRSFGKAVLYCGIRHSTRDAPFPFSLDWPRLRTIVKKHCFQLCSTTWGSISIPRRTLAGHHIAQLELCVLHSQSPVA